MKTATLLGATGLIGGHILETLKEEEFYSKVNVLVRRPFEDEHPKVNVILIDFNDPNEFKKAMADTDVVFCAIGTTKKKVKNDKKAYYKVDYDIPVNAATYCKEQGCEQFLIVSSMGADSRKRNFYLKLKGEVEDALRSINFESLEIFRPSLLLGPREEYRFFEDIGQAFSKILRFVLPLKYKPIEGEKVAKAMVKYAQKKEGGVKVRSFEEF